MKIIHINFSDTEGGAARAVYRIHNALNKKNDISRMWVNNLNSRDLTVKVPFSKIEKTIAIIKARISNRLIKLLKSKNKVIHSLSIFPSKLVKYINESDADIVNLHWVQHEMLSISDIAKIKKPLIWTLHDMWAFCGAEHYTNDYRWEEGYHIKNRPSYEFGPDINRWIWKHKLRCWKTPIQIIVPSQWLSDCVRKSILMCNWPVKVIPNPLDVNLWKPLDKKIAREQLNLPIDRTLLLFGSAEGTKNSLKGFELLSGALKEIKKNSKIKELELIVFGESKPKSISNNGYLTHYVGYLNDDINLRAIYSAADAMIVPSRLEAFGQTASEAQACGTPVVSFKIGGLKDIIKHKETGYLAKAFDVSDLAKGIEWVIENKNIEKLNDKARNHIIEKFNENYIADSYIEIYNKVLSKKK